MVFNRLYLCQAAFVAGVAAELSRVFDALMGGEDMVDKSGSHPGNLVGGDRCSHAAAAERDTAINLPRRDGPGER